MTLPKFIITMSGYFRLGQVNQHKDLLKPGDSCLGGGYYHLLSQISLKGQKRKEVTLVTSCSLCASGWA